MASGREQRAGGWRVLINPASVIFVCVLTLAVLGITVLFSATAAARDDSYFFIKRQLIWMAIALVAGFVVSRLELESLRRYAWAFAGVAIGGLILVLIPGIGVEVNGSRRWLDLGPMRLQVSEFAKLALVFSLAHYLGANQKLIPTFKRGFFYPMLWISLFAGLIFAEGDFGTTLLCGVLGGLLLFVAGVRLIYLVPSLILGGAAFSFAVLNNPVRMGRVMAFLDPQAHRTDVGYQLWQAILAFGAGGVSGVGLGNGRQQMAFLPEAHTDFIFAIMGEEFGVFFTVGVVVLFTTIFIAGLFQLRRAPNLFQFLLVTGCLLLVCLQALINLGVVTGCLPTKGMSLPFISYGGSNLVLMAIIIGLLFNAQRTWSRPALMKQERSMKEVLA